MPEALASAESLAVLLQQPDAADDPVSARALDMALRLASGTVRGYCGWNLTFESRTDVYRGTGTPLLMLPTLRLVSAVVTSADTGETITDFAFYPSGTLLRTPYGVWTGTLSVAYDHGYTVDELPDEIVVVTLEIARRLYINPAGVVSATVNASHSRTFTQAQAGQAGGATLFRSEAAALDRHRVRD